MPPSRSGWEGPISKLTHKPGDLPGSRIIPRRIDSDRTPFVGEGRSPELFDPGTEGIGVFPFFEDEGQPFTGCCDAGFGSGVSPKTKGLIPSAALVLREEI